MKSCKNCVYYSYFPTLSKDVGHKVCKCKIIGEIPLILLDCEHFKERMLEL